MQNEDYWTNTKTGTMVGVQGSLGSPRAWVRRAYNLHSIEDSAYQPGSLIPTEISVAGVWYRPVTQLPRTDPHRELFRYYNVVAPEHLIRAGKHPTYPVIGVAAAVPLAEVWHWLRHYQSMGAALTWWKTPEARVIAEGKTFNKSRKLDHAEIYAKLDSGRSVPEIATALDVPRQNIDYIARKWRTGEPVAHSSIRNHELLNAYHAGVPLEELSLTYKLKPEYIKKLAKASGNVKTTTNNYM